MRKGAATRERILEIAEVAVLSKGFGHDRQSENVPVLFSGCYFAATGPKSDRQAFVRDLLRKLCDEQEDIEWTDDALREDHRRGWWTTIGWLLCGAILVGAAGWHFVPSADQEP